MMIYVTPAEGVSVPGGITIPGNVPFAHDYGSVFQAMLNRIKTTPDDFARAHGLHPKDVAGVIAETATPWPNLLRAIEKSSPLSVRELIDPRYQHRVPVFDDSVNGVVVCHADESASKTRVYHRGGVDAPQVQYYTYFHTAVQKKSPLIPERIVEHYEWDPTDPNLPDEYFNNGHRERQMTVVVGDVNYHWIDGQGKKHIIAARTGDANAISPFTRHSFTVPPGKEGYILAVTDLGAIGNDCFRALAHAVASKHGALAHVDADEKNEYLALMRQVMPVDPASSFDALGGFMFRKYGDVPEETHGPYVRKRLMDETTFHPTFSTFELGLRDDLGLLLDAPRHIWGYNHGKTPVILFWNHERNDAVIEPGASFSIQKHTPYRITNEDDLEGKVLIMESNPAVENPFEQLALVYKFRGEEGLLRAASESELWFKEAAK